MMLLALSVLGCGGSAETPAPAPAPEPAAEAPAPAPAAPRVAARVFFVEPQDGAKLKAPVTVRFGVEGMSVRPAGELVEGTGHHHLIIGPTGIPAGTQVPKDETHIHYGKGQLEDTLDLKPGEYQLTLQFADGNHVSYGEPLSKTIRVTVE
jgi:hypothetical protein